MFRIASLAAAALLAAGAAFAHDGVHVENAYVLTSGPGAMSGAVFFEIVNHSTTSPDRLIAASSDAAQRVELHTHLIDANGVARMVEVEDGFAVAPGETHVARTRRRPRHDDGPDPPAGRRRRRSSSSSPSNAKARWSSKCPVDLDRGDAPMQGGHGAHAGHGTGG